MAGLKDLTVCQVRTAADALIRARWMDGERRREYLRRQGEIIAYTQARNRAAADSHRKAALDRLNQLGINVSTLRCCQME